MNLQYESDEEDSFNQAFGSAAPGPEPEEPQNPRNNKKWIIWFIAGILIIGSIAGCIILFSKKNEDNKEKNPVPGSGYSSKETVVKNLFTYMNERDGDGIESCFPPRDILSDTESKIVDLVITTISGVNYEYDLETLQVTYGEEDISYLFEEDIKVDHEVVPATASVNVKNRQNGKEARIEYSLYLLKTEKWYVIEMSADDDLLKDTTEASKPAADDQRSDSFATGEIEINGKKYQMPFQYSQLKGDFEITHEEDTISGGGRNSYLLKKDGKDTNIMVTVSELMNRDTPARDCHIINVYAEKDDNTIVLPGGGTWGMSPEEIGEIYGTPDYVYGQTDVSYKYEIAISDNEHFNECVMIFRFSDGKTLDIMQYGLY